MNRTTRGIANLPLLISVALGLTLAAPRAGAEPWLAVLTGESCWSCHVSPTGGGMPSDPEVLRLRAQLRRDRQSLEAARQRLRDLDVEASLAGVPDDWMQPPTAPAGD